MRYLIPFLCCAVLATPGTAQSPEQRQHLTALFDSSAATPTAKPSGAFAWARNGILHLQSGTAHDSLPLVRTGMTDFYEATVASPRWPYPWYGLGLAKLQLHNAGARVVMSPHQPAGNDWLNGARQAFAQTLRRDSTFGQAVQGLATVLLLDSLAVGKSATGELVLRWAAHNPIDAPTALALARYTFLLDSFALAENFIHRYLAEGGSVGVGAWEMAKVAFATDRVDLGRDEYYKSVAHADDPALRSLLRSDVSMVASPEEFAEFDSLAPGEVVGWLRDFWEKRELEAGRPTGSRLPVHFERVKYAWDNFRTYKRIESYDISQIFRDAPRGLDDRGVIWVRHGEPDQRATYIRVGAPPNESWMYYRTSGNLIFHFAKLRMSPYRLLESLAAISPREIWWVSENPDLYLSRDFLDPEYTRIAFMIEGDRLRRTGISASVMHLQQRDLQRTREAIRVGTTTDSDPIDLDRTWEPVAQVFGAPASLAGGAGLLIAIALPAPGELKPVALPDGGSGYTVRLRTTAADDSGRTTLDVDSLVRLRTPRPLAKGEYLNIVASYTVAAGTQRVRVIVTDSTGEVGAIRVLNGVPTVDLSQPEFALSDLVVGREGSGVHWMAPDGTPVPLHPLNAWRSSENIEVTFGVSGLPNGTPYKTRIAVADLGADSTRPPRASVEFEKVAAGARELVSQSLGLRELRPGRYLLTVTVTAGDRSIKRERRITIAPAR